MPRDGHGPGHAIGPGDGPICARKGDAFATTASRPTPGRNEADSGELDRGTVVGRYVVVGKLGIGGMRGSGS